MSSLNHFVECGNQDLPVYITEVRYDFLSSIGEDIVIDLTKFDGQINRVNLRLPMADIQTAEHNTFVRDYLLAEIYNILSSLGGLHLTIYTTTHDENLLAMLKELPGVFGIGITRKLRTGYGRCINVIERILDSQGIKENFEIKLIHNDAPAISYTPGKEGNAPTIFLRAFTGMEEKILCGIDVGGTDIKLAVSSKGKLSYLKEYDWFPAKFTRSSQLIEPIRLLARLLRARISCDKAEVSGSVVDQLDRAINESLPDGEIEAIVDRAESMLADQIVGFDGIGLCFPDVVIKNKIVGGEVFKTRGIRNNPNIDYEIEFGKLMNLDDILLEFCSPKGRVYLTNDGPMAAFTASIELIAAGRGSALKDGRFAHTLGTELGTGWIDETGKIPEIPLECYNFMIDLGSFNARQYPPDDLRSINNFNTSLPGTLQKFMGQNGVFRLAIKASQLSDGKLFHELLDRGFIYENHGNVFVTLEPVDMRKPLLEYLMKLCEAGDPMMEQVFREVGRSAGITFCETEHILAPITKERVMYGRLVKKPRCFELMKEGAAEIDQSLQMLVADDHNAFSGLMLQLKANTRYTVAQFAQSVGALYYANYWNEISGSVV